jgi:hypothetical protein
MVISSQRRAGLDDVALLCIIWSHDEKAEAVESDTLQTLEAHAYLFVHCM